MKKNYNHLGIDLALEQSPVSSKVKAVKKDELVLCMYIVCVI